MLDDLRGALAALLDNARASAPHLVTDIEALNAKAQPVIAIAEAAGREAGPAAVAIAVPVAEVALDVELTRRLGPVLGPQAAAAAERVAAFAGAQIAEHFAPPATDAPAA